MAKTKKGKWPEKVALHAIRKPYQRTLPWAAPLKDTLGPSTPTQITVTNPEIGEDIYSQPPEEGMYLESCFSNVRSNR